MKAMIRRATASLVASGCLFVAPAAFAEGEPCYNDIDCPGGGNVCGGDVCNWPKASPMATKEKPYYCNPAGSQPKGQDGWCTTDADCKCAAQGAKCNNVYCTFTKASDAPAGSAGAGTGGAAATGGAPGTGGAAGTAGAAGTPASAGATATAGTGSTAPPPADEGGCSIGGSAQSTSGTALALGLLGLGAMVARRRR